MKRTTSKKQKARWNRGFDKLLRTVEKLSDVVKQLKTEVQGLADAPVEETPCDCEDRPSIRGQSFITQGSSEGYVLASPLQRNLTNAYDCVHDSTEWSIDPAGGPASLSSKLKLSVKVKADGGSTGTVTLTAKTKSHCKCRPDGHRVDCEGQASKTIEVR